jgi:hypothetical protein
MTWDYESLKKLKPSERHALWSNAKKRENDNEQAKAIVCLIETSGLEYRAGGSVRLDDAIGKAMHCVIFSEEGKKAAFEATAKGLPALAGVDPFLATALDSDYGKHNEATIQAGYLVTNMMEQSGYKQAGSGPLPPGCVAKTGLVFLLDKS